MDKQSFKLGCNFPSRKYHLAMDSLILCHKTQKTSKFLLEVKMIATLDKLTASEFRYAMCNKCLKIAEAKVGA